MSASQSGLGPVAILISNGLYIYGVCSMDYGLCRMGGDNLTGDYGGGVFEAVDGGYIIECLDC